MSIVPLVSIITPYYKSLDTIEETISSVLNQTYSNIEYILVNDGSPDEKELNHKLQNLIQDGKIKYLSKDNGGTSSAKNLGASKAKGEYLVFLDADDCLHPKYIEKCVNIFNKLNHTSGVTSYYQHFGSNNKKQKLSYFSYKKLLLENTLPPVTMIRNQDFRNNNGYDENLKIAEDWDLWISIFKKKPEVHIIKEYLFFYRKHSSKKSLSESFKEKDKVNNFYNYIFLKNYQTYLDYYEYHPIYCLNKLKIKNKKRLRKQYRVFIFFSLFIIFLFSMNNLSS